MWLPVLVQISTAFFPFHFGCSFDLNHVRRRLFRFGCCSAVLQYGAGVMVFGNKHLAYNISHATIARNLFVRNGAGQTSSDHGEIALCEPGSTGTIEDNTFFAVDTDPEFVYYETRGPGAVLSSGAWYVNNNTIYGHGEVKNMIAPTVILSHGCPQDSFSDTSETD